MKYDVIVPILRGNQSAQVDQHGTFRLPRAFGTALATDGRDDTLPRLLIMPVGERILLHTPESLNSVASRWFTGTTFGPRFEVYLQGSRVQPSTAVYATDEPVGLLARISEFIIAETLKHPQSLAKLSGKDFERWLFEAFAAHGLIVQHNVRLVGADVDLFLTEWRGEGPSRHMIVECKHYQRSGRPVSLSQVMRLYGLREALGSTLDIKDTILVTSTRFTKPARQFAEAYTMTAIDIQGLRDWFERYASFDPCLKRLPVVDVAILDRGQTLTLQPPLMRYLGLSPGNQLDLFGQFDHLELWKHETFIAKLQSETYTDEDARALGDLGI